MFSSIMNVVIAFALVTFFCGETLAIKCWDCKSTFDQSCNDPFDNSTLPIVDCDFVVLPHYPRVRSTMCRKIIQKGSDGVRYIRTCAYLGEPGIIITEGSNNITMQYYTCNDKDGCNTAALFSFQPHVLLITLGTFIMYIMA